MQLIKTLIGIVFYSFTLSAWSQVKVQTHVINNNDTNLRSLFSTEFKNSVIFFFPTATIKKSEFEIGSKVLIDDLNEETNDLSVQVHFVYYKQDPKSISKGLKFVSGNKLDTLFIGDLKCLLIGFDSTTLFRAKKLMDLNFEVKEVFEHEGIYDVEINDANSCIKIAQWPPNYSKLIKESINPMYSDAEQIKMLKDSISKLEIALKTQSEKVNHLEIENKGINDELKKLAAELLKIQSQLPIKKTHKKQDE